LDPIDGTKGFLRGQQYAVCLAYIVGDSPVVAVLGCPNLPADFEAALDVKDAAGCLYASQRGAGGAGDRAGVAVGACVLTDREVPMRVEPRRGSSDRVPILVESFEPSHSRRDSSEAIMREVVERRFGRGAPVPAVRIDSQCKYAVVARGQADVYLRLPSKRGYVEKIWDHAAGALIAEQAGCVVSDARGKPLDFSCGPDLARNRGVVVAPPGLHADVIGAIAGLGMSEESATR
ncbi:MAG: inositol monophosphatase family protein, partial [Phycisphaerales bacterium]